MTIKLDLKYLQKEIRTQGEGTEEDSGCIAGGDAPSKLSELKPGDKCTVIKDFLAGTEMILKGQQISLVRPLFATKGIWISEYHPRVGGQDNFYIPVKNLKRN